MNYSPAPCRAVGCSTLCLRSTWSPYCPKHRKALSRYGHPLQTPVTTHELTPQLAAVQGWRKRNPASPAWGILLDRWATLAGHAQDINARRTAGKAFIRHEAGAADLLRTVADAGDPEKAINMVLALHLLLIQQPHRFRDARGFRFVMARRVRLTADISQGTYWNHKAQRVTRVYRDVNPRAVDVLGQWLAEAFGEAGVQLADLERRRGHLLAEAFAAMQ